MTDTIVERLVAWAHNLRFEDLPPETVHQAKRLVADSIGCGLAAFRAEPVVAATKVATGISVRSPATILGTRTTTTPDLAAFEDQRDHRLTDEQQADHCGQGDEHGASQAA